MKSKKYEKEFEVNGKKVGDLVAEGKKRRLVFVDQRGEVVVSMVLLWGAIIAILLWPFFVLGAVLTLASGGSVKIEKR